MAKSDLKKMIVFSTPENRTFIECAIKDRAAIEGCTESTIYERCCLQSLLPFERNAAFWVRKLYYNKDHPADCLGSAFYDVFAYAAAGLDWEANVTNTRPLVELLHSTVSSNPPTLTGKEPQWNHLISQLESIVEYISRFSNDSEAEKEATMGQRLLEHIYSYKTDPAIPLRCLTYFLDNWSTINNYTRTYRALCDIAQLAPPPNTPHNRCKFIDTLTFIAAEWH